MPNRIKAIAGPTWLDSLGLGYSTQWSDSFGATGGGGCDEATVTLAAPAGYRHPDLRAGKPLTVKNGGYTVFSGQIDDVDVDTWEIHAQGLSRLAADALCLDGSGNTTSIANTAIDQAIAEGYLPGVTRPTSISSTAYSASSSTTDVNTLDTLLDGVAQEAGKWWTIWADGIIRLEAVPTVPYYHLVPKAVDLPVTYEDYASVIKLRYYNSTSHAAATATATDAEAAAFLKKALAVDATDLGEISATRAGNLAAGILAQGRATPGYTASVEASGWQLLNDNFAPVDPATVRAGRLVRLHGRFAAGPTIAPYVDFTIGRSSHDTTEPSTVTLDPMNLTTNGAQEDVIAMVLGAAWDQKFGG